MGRSRLQGQHMNKNVSAFLNYQPIPLLFIYFIVLYFGGFACIMVVPHVHAVATDTRRGQ